MEALLYDYSVDIVFSGHVSSHSSSLVCMNKRICDCGHLFSFFFFFSGTIKCFQYKH